MLRRRDGRRGFSLLTRFGVLSLVLLAAVGVAVGSRLETVQTDRRLDDAVHTAEVIAHVGVQPLLDPADLQRDFLPLDDASRQRLDDALGNSVSTNGIVRLKVWNLQHWIVYSDNDRLVGRWFASDDALRRALNGETNSFVTDLSAPEELEERDFGRLLAVYVPLRVDDNGLFTTSEDGTVVGAFEMYLPYAPIAAAIDRDTRQLYLALAIGLVVLYVCLFRLVAGASRRLRRQAAESEFKATHDPLTKLANRQLLLVELADAVQRAEPAHQVALLLLDLDHFKEINDTLGHGSGDEVLLAIADRLNRFSLATSIARLGGDEFALVYERISDARSARQIGLNLAKLLDEPIEVSGVRLSVACSVGVSLSPKHSTDAEVLVQYADVAMYVAKRGAETCVVYTDEIDNYSPERLGLAAEVRGAIEQGQIRVHYQPKVDIETRRIVGVEALVRWEHPQRGLVMPGLFLPVIENTDLIGPLTWHVLDLAVAQCAAWRAIGIELPVAVNLSARTMSDSTVPRQVRKALAAHRLPAPMLELELTESAVLGDHSSAASILNELRAIGVSLAVDDFGTGYASISYLTTLPLDVLKIDRSFVASVITDSTAAAVVSFTLDLARHLKLKVVAEGVEDADVMAVLGLMGCDVAQGYHISRPLPAEQVPEWLARWEADTAALTTSHPEAAPSTAGAT